MATKKSIVILVSGIMLSGCIENEDDCYNNLVQDFESSQAFASEQIRSIPEYMKDDRQGYMDYAATASRSKVRISQIYRDNDQSACDYISDGPNLRRK